MGHRIIHIPDHEVVIEIPTGTLDLDDLVAMKREEDARGLLHSGVRILCDLRRANLALRSPELDALRDWLFDQLGERTGLRAGLIVEDSMTTALTLLFKRKVSGRTPVEVFSTVDGALTWLGLARDEIEAHWPELDDPPPALAKTDDPARGG